MTTLSDDDSRRMYSWWWDSHISPKNSKWLHENLTDINGKVRTMIKLIEEDADSFAKRAEMYYKKRPELMSLVEEFYRAYRALAERYDHATGGLRQAHRSLAEAFPDQFFLLTSDDSTNDMSTSVHAFKQLDDLFASDLRHSRFAEGKSRKRLNFDDGEAKKAESEVDTLKKAIEKLTEEKEAAAVEYQKCLESISSLEKNASFAFKEVEKLKNEVDNGVVKFKGVEERCLLLERSNQTLHSDLDLLMLKAESQSRELTEKDREVGRLSACIEEQHSRYVEAETAFKALQNLHSQAQEELRSMAACNESLRHELNEMSKKHRTILEGFDALGFSPEHFEFSVKKLRDENVILQENFQREKSEKVALLEELLDKIALLENCLIDAHDELEVSKAKSKSLEDSYQVLVKQNNDLNSQNQRLESMDKRFMDLEEKYAALENEKKSTLFKVEKLKASLEGQKDEQVSFSKISESRLSGIETWIRVLQEESRRKNQESVEELDKALDSQIESFVLRKCVQELEEKNSTLLIECHKLIEASQLSEVLISDLKKDNLNLKKEKDRVIEEEKFAQFGETLSFNYFALIFKNFVYERSVDMKEIQENLKEVQIENLNLKEGLQKSEHELIALTFFSDQLNYEVVNGKNMLKHKEREHWEAQRKLESKENENWELLIQVDDLKSKYNEVNSICKQQANRIFRLSEDNDRVSKQNHCLVEELLQLRKDREESQTQNERFKDLNAQLHILESENGQLKAQLDPHSPAIICLRDSISSLENHILLHTNHQKFNSEIDKDDAMMTQPLATSHQTENKDAYLALQDLQNRVEAIERMLTEKEQETVDTQTKREDPQRQNTKAKSEMSVVESRCLTKDSTLDQASECSSQEAESQMAELWETVDHDSSIDLTVGRSKGNDIEYRQLLSVKTKSSRFRLEELNGDELELSKRLVENRREGSKRKILEKLNSDVQKLTNLQITVQDLKNKVQIIEDSKKVKGNVERDSLKLELEEAEVAIDKLFDVHEKLVRSFEEKKSSGESGSVRRRRIQEQARRASEKIGRLQLEIQKIQFILMKIDKEKESKGRVGIVLDANKRVLLRDYIFSGVRQSRRPKKAPFCGCIQPSTRGE